MKRSNSIDVDVWIDDYVGGIFIAPVSLEEQDIYEDTYGMRNIFMNTEEFVRNEIPNPKKFLKDRRTRLKVTPWKLGLWYTYSRYQFPEFSRGQFEA